MWKTRRFIVYYNDNFVCIGKFKWNEIENKTLSDINLKLLFK